MSDAPETAPPPADDAPAGGAGRRTPARAWLELCAAGLLAWPLAFGLAGRALGGAPGWGDLGGGVFAAGLALWAVRTRAPEALPAFRRRYLVACAAAFAAILAGFRLAPWIPGG